MNRADSDVVTQCEDCASAPDTAPSLDTWRAAGLEFEFTGQRIFYRRAGKGPPLLLIHGFPTAGWDWYKLWPGLTAGFDVIAPDLLGFGFSSKPKRHRYGIREQADLCEALCHALGIRRCHVFCHDYGDTVAQELLARQHEGTARLELASLCLLNGGLFPETHRPRLIQRLLASRVGPLLARLSSKRRFVRSISAIFGPNTQPSASELEAFWTLLMHEDGRAVMPQLIGYMRERRVHRARWVGALIDTSIPMRIINGVLDPVSGEHMLARLLSLRPDADVVKLPVGHYPQIEAPAQTLAAWLSFVERVLAQETEQHRSFERPLL